MIMPTKHIPTGQSLLGLGGILLDNLRTHQTVTRLWDTCRHHPDVKTFHRFILALDLLYTLGSIELFEGELRRVKK